MTKQTSSCGPVHGPLRKCGTDGLFQFAGSLRYVLHNPQSVQVKCGSEAG